MIQPTPINRKQLSEMIRKAIAVLETLLAEADPPAPAIPQRNARAPKPLHERTANNIAEANRAEYEDYLRGASHNSPECPECGGGMVSRSSAWGKFWGCKAYPECKGKRREDGDNNTKFRDRKGAATLEGRVR